MDEKCIAKLGIPIEPEVGVADGINKQHILERHANLAKIDFWRLGYVAEYISKLSRQKEDRYQLSDKKVFKLIESQISLNNIDIALVNKGLQESYKHAQLKYVGK